MNYQNRDQQSATRTATPAKFGSFVLFEHGAERLNITVEAFSERVNANGFQIIQTREGQKMVNRADFHKMEGK